MYIYIPDTKIDKLIREIINKLKSESKELDLDVKEILYKNLDKLYD